MTYKPDVDVDRAVEYLEEAEQLIETVAESDRIPSDISNPTKQAMFNVRNRREELEEVEE